MFELLLLLVRANFARHAAPKNEKPASVEVADQHWYPALPFALIFMGTVLLGKQV